MSARVSAGRAALPWMCGHRHTPPHTQGHTDMLTRPHTVTCTHIHRDTLTHPHTHTCVHTQGHRHAHTPSHMHIHMDTQTCSHAFTQSHTHTRMHTDLCPFSLGLSAVPSGWSTSKLQAQPRACFKAKEPTCSSQLAFGRLTSSKLPASHQLLTNPSDYLEEAAPVARLCSICPVKDLGTDRCEPWCPPTGESRLPCGQGSPPEKPRSSWASGNQTHQDPPGQDRRAPTRTP